jgi:ligand-binding sensor domain-containing protein
MNSARRQLAWIIAIAALAGLFAVDAHAAGKWKSFVDPSFISEIVLRDGKLYMATSGGLVIYDPTTETFDQYTNTIGLPSNFLTSLLFDHRGSLWVGTERSGVSRLDGAPGRFNVVNLSSTLHGLSDDQITDLAAWGDTLVYATKKGMGLIIEDFPGPRLFKRDGLPSDIVHAVLPDGDRVWVATDAGVVYLDKFGFIHSPTDTLFPAFSLARTDTALWAGTDRGVATLKDGATTWVFTKLGPDPTPRAVFSLAFDGERLWAGARARFFWSSGTTWHETPIFNLYTKYAPFNNTICEIRALQPMPGGTAYLGAGDPTSARRGVNLLYFDGTQVRDITFNTIPMNGIWRLDFDVDESLWISTSGFGVAKLTPTGEWFEYNGAVGDTKLSSPFNLSLLADSQGSKWFARSRYPLEAPLTPLDELQDQFDTDRGNDVWTYRQVGEGGGDALGSLRNLGALEDPEGNRWWLSDEDQQNAPGWWGINILSRDKSTWRQVNPTSTDPSGLLRAMKAGNVFDVALGENGVAIIALKGYGVQRWTTGGFDQAHLFDFSDDTWTTIAAVGAPGGIASEADVVSVALRSDGIVWIGTSVGLYQYDRGVLTYIPQNTGFGNGLLGPVVNDLVLDRQENLWVATNLGLNRIARDDINDIRSFTTPIVYQTQLNLFFPPSVVSPIVDEYCDRLALHPTKDFLYIATHNGLAELDIASLEETSSGISKVYLYPNPVRGSRGDKSLKIANIDTEVLVEIFTVEGELVHSGRVASPGDVAWDLTTKAGFIAASGTYVVRISGGGTVVTKSVSIIR